MYKRFEMLLKQFNTTPAEVAKATGISTATLSCWKSGAYTPKFDKLKKIADHFHVSVDWLMGKSTSQLPYTTGLSVADSLPIPLQLQLLLEQTRKIISALEDDESAKGTYETAPKALKWSTEQKKYAHYLLKQTARNLQFICEDYN